MKPHYEVSSEAKPKNEFESQMSCQHNIIKQCVFCSCGAEKITMDAAASAISVQMFGLNKHTPLNNVMNAVCKEICVLKL
jgi:hypothetical protein